MRRIASLSKLRIAWSSLNKRNKNSAGVDGVSIAAFQANAEKNLKKIAEQIATGTYQFRGSKGVLLPKNDGKKRPLKIATIRDRVVAKAIALHLGPRLQKFDQPCSFGYRKGLSTRNAVEEIHRLADAGAQWVLEADIKKFFDKVDRKTLIQKLSKIVRSKERLAFIQMALTSEIENKSQIDPDLLGLFPAAGAGIPQGSQLSPLLANFYMHKFDKAMLKKGYGLIRYADDFVVLCRSKIEAEEAYKYASDFLKRQLGLDLHELSEKGKTQIRRYTDGFEFLGFFIRDKKQMPCKKSKENYKSRVKEILGLEQAETLVKKVQRLNNVSKGWHEAFKTADLGDFPREADELLYTELSRFLKKHRLFQTGDNLSWSQLKFLGVKSLKDRIRESTKAENKPASGNKGRGPRRKASKEETTKPTQSKPAAQPSPPPAANSPT